MNRKIMIVFEETGESGVDSKGRPGKKFNVYMGGDIDRLTNENIPDSELSTAEFWASRSMAVVVDLLRKSGVIQTETRRQ